MKSKDVAEHNLNKVLVNLAVIVVFTILMATAIIYVYDSEPDVEAEIMRGYARQFATSATNAHWQWQAEGRPEMIMLVHYDNEGKEVGRRPVRMAHFGWPKVEPSSESCLQLWEQLLNTSTRVEGFRVLGDYYASDNEGEQTPNARCRYRVSTGPYFDYSIYTGIVQQSGNDQFVKKLGVQELSMTHCKRYNAGSQIAGVKGFTLIELTIVVVLLGLLAAVAIPRFLDVTEQAEDATIEAVSGGFATGVGLVRAEWELEARPRDNQGTNLSFVTIDGIIVGVDRNTGYPTGQVNNDNSTEDDAMSALDCESIFNLIMQSAPTITSNWANRPFDSFRYFTNFSNGTGSGGNDLCFYYLSKSVRNLQNAPTDDTVGDGFIYDPRIGQVVVFSNNTNNSSNQYSKRCTQLKNSE